MAIQLPFGPTDLAQFTENCLATDASYLETPELGVLSPRFAQLEHAVLGMLTEIPELYDAVHRIYRCCQLMEDCGHGVMVDNDGRDLILPFLVNALEELGDMQWYAALYDTAQLALNENSAYRLLPLLTGRTRWNVADLRVCSLWAPVELDYRVLQRLELLDYLKKLKFYNRWSTETPKGSDRMAGLHVQAHALYDWAFHALDTVLTMLHMHWKADNAHALCGRLIGPGDLAPAFHKARLMVSYKLIAKRYGSQWTEARADLRDCQGERELMTSILLNTKL